MSNISQLSSTDELSLADLLPIWQQGNSDTRKVSLSVLAAFLQGQMSASGGLITQYAAPAATGFSVTISPPTAGASMWLLLTPNAGYAAGTIVMPSLPVDGQEVVVNTTQAVTALTVNGNGSGVVGAPTTLAANAFFRLRYDGVLKNFYRIA